MKNYKVTLIGLIISLLLYIFTIIFNLDLFENLLELLHHLEEWEIDELALPVLIIGVSLLLNLFLTNRKKRVEIEKYKIYRSMLNSLHHILNNFLNQAQIVRLEAENSSDFDKEVIELYDQIIDEAKELTQSLEDVHKISEETIIDSVKP